MPETYREFVNRILRDHEGGDPATYPVGDRSTARKPINKRDLRAALLAQEDKVEEATAAAGQAIAAAGSAAQALSDVQGATFFAANLTTLLANTESFSAGTVFATREEGFSYKVVTSNPHFTTAGGVMLQVVPRNGVVTPPMFGVKADGGTYTTQIAAMIAFAASSGAIIDGEGKTYKVGSTLSLTPHRARWRNITIDGTGITTNGLFTTPVVEMLCADPVQIGTATANVLENVSQATLSSVAGLAAGEWVLLTSQKKMAETEVEGQTSRHSRAAELLRVKSIAGNVVTFWSKTKDRYNSSDTATIWKVQTAGGVDWENVTLIGADVGFLIQDGFESRYRNCTFINQTARGINEDRCYRSDGDGWTFKSEATDPAFTAAPYGLSFTACQGCNYGSVRSDRIRHTTTTGSNSSSRGRYVSRGCTLGDIYATNSFSSVVDQHPGGGFLQVGDVYAEFAENASHFIACQFQGAGGSVKSIEVNNGWGLLFDSYGFTQVGFNPTVFIGSLNCNLGEYAVSISNYTNRYATGTAQKVVVNIGLINATCGTGIAINPQSSNIECVITGGQINALAAYGLGDGLRGGSDSSISRIRLSNMDIQIPAGRFITDLRNVDVSIVGGSLRGSGGAATVKVNSGAVRMVGVSEANLTTDLTNGATLLRATMA